MSKLPTISEAEYQVMKVIWDKAPISTTDVVIELTKTSEWTPKTIQSLLGRLVKKGALAYEKESRVFVYTSLVKEEDYLEKESDTFLNRFYNGAINSMVVNFLNKNKLTKEDITELKKILDDQLEKGED